MARDINDRARRNLSNRVQKGDEIREFNEAKSQLMEVLAEQRRNLDERRVIGDSVSRQEQIMMQAGELGTTSPGNFNPATMELLNQYGLGQPQVQSSTSRSTSAGPQNIVVNNNTTNNVQVAGGGVGTSGDSTAKFKTWITGVNANQNEEAARREKDYQRRDWELTRTTNKLMNRLDEIGTGFEERTDPEKTNTALITGLKSVLLLLGFGLLMKNIKSVGNFLGGLTGFFGLKEGSNYNPDGFFKSGFVTSIRNIFTGEGNIGQKGMSLASSIVSGVATAIGNLTAPLTNSIKDALKSFADDRAEAFKAITFPTLDMKDLNGSFSKIIQYLGQIVKVGFGGTSSLAQVKSETARSTAIKEITSTDGIDKENGRDKSKTWQNAPNTQNDFMGMGHTSRARNSQEVAKKLGLKHEFGEVAMGDAGTLVKDDSGRYYDNRIREIDVKGGALVGLAGQVRGNAAVESMLLDKGNKVYASQAYTALGMLKETAKKEGSVLISPETLAALGISPSHIPKQGEVYVTAQSQDRTDAQILHDYYINADSAQQAAIKAAGMQFLSDFAGNMAKNSFGGLFGGMASWGIDSLLGGEGDDAVDAFMNKNEEIKELIDKERKKGANKTYGLVESTDKSGKKFYKLSLSDFEGLEGVMSHGLQEYLPGQIDSNGRYTHDSFNFDSEDGGISLKAFTDKRVQIKENEAIKKADNRSSYLDQTASPEFKERNKEARRKEELSKITTDYNVDDLEKSIIAYNKPKLKKGEYTFGNAPKKGWGNYTGYTGKNPIPKEESRRRAAALIRYFVEVHGLKPFQAAGIVGNLWRESMLFEGSVNEGYSSRATGLAQWLGEGGAGSGNNRKGYLLSAFGDYPSFEEQVRFIEHEFGLRQIEKLGEGGGWAERAGAWEDIKNSTSGQEAHDIFLTRYEFGPAKQSIWNVARELDTHNRPGDGLKTINRGRNYTAEAAELDIYGEYAGNPTDYLDISERYSISKDRIKAEKDRILNAGKDINSYMPMADSVLELPLTNATTQPIPFEYGDVLEKNKAKINAKLDTTGEDIALNTATSAELLGEMALGIGQLCMLTAAQKNIPYSSPISPTTTVPRVTTKSSNTSKVTSN